MNFNELPTIIEKEIFKPADVLLVGTHVRKDSGKNTGYVSLDIGDDADDTLELQLTVAADENKTQVALIYGYMFEANFYRLPKPTLMVVKGKETAIPNQSLSSGEAGLFYWRMHKLDRCSEITVEEGFVQEMLLEKNLPGKRAPNTYAANMQMAHRGGRLNGS
ncbi:MAG: hypothetical protein AAGA88_05370 [Pseudomonadota bacterium]